MIITPNLHYYGNCLQALDLYKRAFAGEITMVMHWSEADPADLERQLTDEEKNYVYHAEMTIGGQRFFFSDSLDPIPGGRNMSIVITFDTPEEVRKAYNIMMEGGTAFTPLTETAYSSCCASLVDKFGMRWEIMTETT